MNQAFIIWATAGYLLMALSQLFDKALLNKVLKEPKAFVFLTGALGIFAVILWPWVGQLPNLFTLVLALGSGACFVLALLPFFSALQTDSASRVIPLVGALTPLVSLVGEIVFLHATFSPHQIWAFILLVMGGVVLTFSKSPEQHHSKLAILQTILAAVLFSASFLSSKYVYNQTDFITGFFWMRWGGLLAALYLLCSKQVQQGLKEFWQNNRALVKLGYFGNQFLAGMGFIMQSIAISLASVTLVNALQGVQYIFVILFVVLFSYFNPNLLQEHLNAKLILEKLVAVLIVVAGLAMLAL